MNKHQLNEKKGKQICFFSFFFPFRLASNGVLLWGWLLIKKKKRVCCKFSSLLQMQVLRCMLASSYFFIFNKILTNLHNPMPGTQLCDGSCTHIPQHWLAQYHHSDRVCHLPLELTLTMLCFRCTLWHKQHDAQSSGKTQHNSLSQL